MKAQSDLLPDHYLTAAHAVIIARRALLAAAQQAAARALCLKLETKRLKLQLEKAR